MTTANNGPVDSSNSSGRKAIRCGKTGVQLSTHPATLTSTDSNATNGDDIRIRSLAHDRRIFDKALEEQLLLGTPDLSAWTTTMYPVIHFHQDVRTYLTGTASTAPNTSTTPNAKTEPPATTRMNSTASTTTSPATTASNASRIRQQPFSAIRRRLQQSRSHLTTTNPAAPARTPTNRMRTHIPAIRQRFQQVARNPVAAISSDIRQFFPGRSNAS
jgi:hypothetical protein